MLYSLLRLAFRVSHFSRFKCFEKPIIHIPTFVSNKK
nr:MAG TPA: hypothetical protein [Caudoviricetes sp.]